MKERVRVFIWVNVRAFVCARGRERESSQPKGGGEKLENCVTRFKSETKRNWTGDVGWKIAPICRRLETIYHWTAAKTGNHYRFWWLYPNNWSISSVYWQKAQRHRHQMIALSHRSDFAAVAASAAAAASAAIGAIKNETSKKCCCRYSEEKNQFTKNNKTFSVK